MADTGWTFGGTANGAFVDRGVFWAFVSRLNTDDSSFASLVFAGVGAGNTAHLDNYGFAIPAGATIDGIEVQFYDYSYNSSAVDFTSVRLTKDSGGATEVGDNNATDFTDPATTARTSTGGGASDLWGTTWSESEIENAEFGVAFYVSALGSSTYVQDAAAIKVYYTTGPTITDVDTDETWDDGDTGLVITGTGFI